nr:Tensin phosphotyrosine-binding and Variant SH3 domain containing protein [Haemonchus contortus]
MRRGNDAYQKPPISGGYYYSRVGAGPPSSAPSPSSSHRHPSQTHMPYHDMSNAAPPRSVMGSRIDDVTPSYYVEHLATFAVGRQFGLTFPADGIRKLKQMEKNSAIWAQPLVLRFRQNGVTVEDENGDLVEQFPLNLIEQPTAHVSSDPRDTYNNILLFIVREDTRNKRSATPTEMHIFQCNRVAATEVADDLQWYIRGQFKKVRNGRRNSGPGQPVRLPSDFLQYPTDDGSFQGDNSELFERDVNTLNRCFDDIERFVARIQSAAFAQRELEQQAHRYRTAMRRDKRNGPPPPDPNGILQMRAQLPIEPEFVDIFRKFKLSFNLLAKLKNHIHEPNAPELLHFLFTPLTVILEACHWGLGRNIAPQIVSPLLSLEARELMQNCLTSKESDVWMSLGETWRTPPEDWVGPLPPPYKPVFVDGFAPYGLPEQQRIPSHSLGYPMPLHRGESAPPVQYRPSPRDRSVDTAPSTPLNNRTKGRPQRNMSVDNLDLDRLSLERERLDFERQKMLERERRLLDEEKIIKAERARLEAERKLMKHESESMNANRSKSIYEPPPSSQASPMPARGNLRPVMLPDLGDQSPRQRAFVEDAIGRGGKLVVATFDRVAQNAKELTVSRGEYLEVLEDTKNWWECRNVHQRVGYVPHTILSMVPLEPADNRDVYGSRDNSSMPNGHAHGSSPKPAQSSEAAVQANVYPSNANAHGYRGSIVTLDSLMVSPEPDLVPQYHDRIDEVGEYVPPTTVKPHIAIARRGREDRALVAELRETVGKAVGEIVRKKEPRPQATIQLHEGSTAEDVLLWLQEKGFSLRVIELLEGQDGANLFALNKATLMQACGKEEGSRLYSQLLVQKNQSNYRTHSSAELQAILNYRKKHVDVTNEADGKNGADGKNEADGSEEATAL